MCLFIRYKIDFACIFFYLIFSFSTFSQVIGNVVNENIQPAAKGEDVEKVAIGDKQKDVNSEVSDQDKVKSQYIEQTEKEEIIRKERELQADAIIDKAWRNYMKRNYEKARDQYLESIDLLRKCSPGGPRIDKKIENITDSLAKLYIHWAESIVKQAKEKAEAGDIDKAVELCNKAMEMNPATKGELNDLLEKYNNTKSVIKYRKDTSEKTIDPNKEDRLYRIDVLYEQGKVLFEKKHYDKARDKFEEILVLDPYNLNAIKYLRLTNERLYDAGSYRSILTDYERMSEVEWKKLTPIISRSLSGKRGEAAPEAEPILKEGDLDTIQKKLEDIIIDHIEFEEVSIYNVINYLRKRSKDLDPQGKGVNIFLNIKKDEQSGAAAPEAPQGEEAEGEGKVGEEAAVGAEGGVAEGGGEGAVTDVQQATAAEHPITIVVDKIPLKEAIEYICRGAGLKYRIRKYAVEIASQNVPFEDLETKIFPIERETFEKESLAPEGAAAAEGTLNVADYFKQRGVSFNINGAKIVYDPRISRLIATNTPENIIAIDNIIRDVNVPNPQVLIQAKFVELRQSNFDELGFQWQLSRTTPKSDSIYGKNYDANGQPINPLNGQAYPALTPVPNMNAKGMNQYQYPANDNPFKANDQLMRYADGGINNRGAIESKDKVFGLSYVDSHDIRYEAIVHALNKCKSIDILASPRVTTQNGQQAVIRMITDQYFPTSWNEAQLISSDVIGNIFSPSTPQFGEPTPIGVQLTVTPTVDADRYTIDLNMEPVVQTFIGWTDYSYNVTIGPNQVIPNTLRMPIIEARTVQTTMRVYDSHTVVMGGIMNDTSNVVDDRVPVLGDLPLVGRLFRSKINDNNKANLLIFVTARLVNPDGSPLRSREQDGLPPFRM